MRGRNSNNELIKERLGWAPSISLKEGLKVTYFWIKGEIEKEAKAGVKAEEYAKSMVVQTMAPKELGHLRASDAEEFVGKK